MRHAVLVLVLSGTLLLSGCLQAATRPDIEADRLLPFHGWPDPPASCSQQNVTYPFDADEVQPRLDLSFTARPESLAIRDLSASESLTVRETIAKSLPVLDRRNGSLETLMRPVMDGGYPYHHIGDWTFTVTIRYHDGPNDTHDFYVDKADNRSYTRTTAAGERFETRDPPGTFEIEYAEARLHVSNRSAIVADRIIMEWNNETRVIPDRFVFSSARWTPVGTECVLVGYHQPVEPGEVWQPWCIRSRSVWVDLDDGQVEAVPLSGEAQEYC